MSCFKVLPLKLYGDFHRKRLLQECQQYNREVVPEFNREGRYYNRVLKRTWNEFEVDGKMYAFVLKSDDSFLYDLCLLHHKPLCDAEVKHLKGVYHLLTPTQKKLLATDNTYKMLNRAERRMRLQRSNHRRKGVTI